MSTPQATTADAPNTTFVTDSPTNQQVELHGSIWMTIGGANFGGAGRIGLLAQIAESGSISKAAKAIGMSYKAAWDAIDIMNNLAGQPLVERTVGGKGGGGERRGGWHDVRLGVRGRNDVYVEGGGVVRLHDSGWLLVRRRDRAQSGGRRQRSHGCSGDAGAWGRGPRKEGGGKRAGTHR